MSSAPDLPVLDASDAFAALPPEPNLDTLGDIRRRLPTAPCLVVLDDDPTGTQTCHDISVLTSWSVDELERELREGTPGFFVLTNSRAFPPEPARELMRGICANLRAAASRADREVRVVLRGDSTLRGHFPLEPEAAEEGLGVRHDGWVLLPFFLQGNRYTIGDVHYLGKEGKLVPVGQTEFAKDKAFGYRSSDLKDYVEEKTGGAIKASEVATISIDDLRLGGPGKVASILSSLPPRTVIAVNAASEQDVRIFVLGLLDCEQRTGKRFLYRTAAAFVSARLGMPPKKPVGPAEFGLRPEQAAAGGLIVVGSYVPTTTSQVEALTRDNDELEVITLDVGQIAALDPDSPELAALVDSVSQRARDRIIDGRDCLILTSRSLVSGPDAASSLAIGSQASAALVRIVRGIAVRPRYLVAKGGITSSDLATKALGMRRAAVVGQAAPGIPLWRGDAGSLWPGVPYIVFPGNTGGTETLREVYEKWKAGAEGVPEPRAPFSKGR